MVNRQFLFRAAFYAHENSVKTITQRTVMVINVFKKSDVINLKSHPDMFYYM